MPPVSRDFQYQAGASRLVLMVMVSVAVPIALAYIAMTNIEGTRVFGRLIQLSPTQATALYWILSLLTTIAAAVAIRVAINSFSGPKHVSLGPAHAVVPKASVLGGWFAIRYSSIQGIHCTNVLGGNTMLVIRSSVGESRLMSSYFDGLSEFESFVASLQANTAG